MSYLRAEEILPPELLSQVQHYAQGQTLYIPKRDERRSWGAVSGAKELLAKRNLEIQARRAAGESIRELAAQYCLSEKTIQAICAACRREAAP